MSDPEDGADRDGPSEDPPADDPFIYPADEGGDDAADRDDAADGDAPGSGSTGTVRGADTGAGSAAAGGSSSSTSQPASTGAAAGPGAAADSGTPAGAPGTPEANRLSGTTSVADGAAAGSGGARGAASRGTATDDSPQGVGGWLRWFWTADSGAAVYTRDVLTSVGAVLAVGLVLFAISGIWPPMVAVESPSMEPNMNTGDLVFVVDNERYVPDAAQEYQGETTGVVAADRGAEIGYTAFNGSGDVIIFMPDGDARQTPVIHRAMLFVNESENWYDRAAALDPDAVGNADSCQELNNCPAPHAGFVTKGDNNLRYDQQTTLSSPVKPAWIIGTAELRVPYLGYVRLAFSGQVGPAADVAPRAPVAPGQVAATGADAPAAPTPPDYPPTASGPATVPTGSAGRPVA